MAVMALLGLLIFVHYISLFVPYNIFLFLRQVSLSISITVGLGGGILLLKQAQGITGRKLFAWVLFAVAVMSLIGLVNQARNSSPFVLPTYRFISPMVTLYGNTFGYLFMLYPLEVLRPGWLTFRRAFLIYLPVLVMALIYYLTLSYFPCYMRPLDGWKDMVTGFFSFRVWFRLLSVIYVFLPLIFALRYRQEYSRWCEDNYASQEGIDIGWLDRYLVTFVITMVSYMIVIFSNNRHTMLVHGFVLIIFLAYNAYHVLYHKNPYPEGYFKQGMNRVQKELEEEQQEEREIETNRTNDPILNEGKKEREQSGFVEKIPEYREIVVQWMATRKPYTDKDFMLLDVMEVLPLNRSYLSRVFNEGFGAPFNKVVKDYRMQEAKEYLKNRPHLNVATIAELCGFSSPSVFGRTFLQEEGMTPRQWRDSQ